MASLQGQRKAPQLAYTKSLLNRELSPLSKLKQTRGLVTLKVVPSNFERKRAEAAIEYPKAGFKFQPTQEFKFRETNIDKILLPGQVDFKLASLPAPIENPGFKSVHNTLPKYISEKEAKVKAKLQIAEGLKGKKSFELYHKKLPLNHVNIAQSLPDRF